jgi:hypothetical protein
VRDESFGQPIRGKSRVRSLLLHLLIPLHIMELLMHSLSPTRPGDPIVIHGNVYDRGQSLMRRLPVFPPQAVLQQDSIWDVWQRHRAFQPLADSLSHADRPEIIWSNNADQVLLP